MIHGRFTGGSPALGALADAAQLNLEILSDGEGLRAGPV
jgi:hypothetical protein